MNPRRPKTARPSSPAAKSTNRCAAADFDAATFEDPLALTLVDLDKGRAKPRVILDAMAGSEVYRRGETKLELQAGVLNLFDRAYLLNFLSIFNGTHYGAPRTWTARLKVGF